MPNRYSLEHLREHRDHLNDMLLSEAEEVERLEEMLVERERKMRELGKQIASLDETIDQLEVKDD